MSRWQIEGNADYYTRYRNYENYLRANANRLGLSTEQVTEQLGRYAQGLQDKMQIEPERIQVGRDIARNPQAYGVMNPNKVTQNLEDAQKQLQKLTTELGNGATSTTYLGTTEQLREAAPLGNTAPEIPMKSEFEKVFEKSQLYKSTGGNSVDKLGKRKQKEIAEEIEKLARLAKTPEERKLLEERIAKFRGGNDQVLFNKVLQENTPAAAEAQVKPQAPSEPKSRTSKTWKQYCESHGIEYKAPEKFGGIEADRRAQEIIARNEQNKLPLQETSNPLEQKPQAQAELNPQASIEAKPKSKVKAKSTGFLSKVKNAMKGKKGKAALIAAGAAVLVGAGIALFAGKDDKTVNNEKVLPQPTHDEEPIPSDTVPEQQPVEPVVPTPQPEPVIEPEPEYEEYTVKKGDHFWGLAKKELIEAHKDDPNYKPSDKEILELAEQIMEDNNYGFDDNHWYSDPMLMPEDEIRIRKVA